MCQEPAGVVPWHLSLFSVLLVMGLIQVALCAFQVINGLLGALCGDCCGGVSIYSAMSFSLVEHSFLFSFMTRIKILLSVTFLLA